MGTPAVLQESIGYIVLPEYPATAQDKLISLYCGTPQLNVHCIGTTASRSVEGKLSPA